MKVQVKLDLKGKSDVQLKQFSLEHIDKMDGNGAFDTPSPDAKSFQSAHDAFDVALGDSDAAQKTATEKTNIKEGLRAGLESALTQRGHYIESIPGVTADQVLSVGFGVKSAGSPTGTPDKVTGLSLTTGDNNGEVDAHWNRADGARSYAVQFSADPFTDSSWQNAPGVTKSKTALLGLKSGTKVWVRVQAVGSGGIGAWSDPVAIIAP